MDEDEIHRLRRVQRRAWGATLAGTGLLLLLLFVAGLLFLLWLWRLAEGSPTVS